MMKLKVGKPYVHNQTQEQVVITDIETGSSQGKPTMIHLPGKSLSAHEFKQTYRHLGAVQN